MSLSTPTAAAGPDALARLQQASDLLRQERREEAVNLLRALVREAPGLAQAHRLLGVALSETGDWLGAEAAFREALAVEPSLLSAAVGLAEALRYADRGAEAMEVLAPFATKDATDLSLLTYYGAALQSVGRAEEALSWLRQATATSPTSGVAEHNLAGALGDAQEFAESEQAARRAMMRGLDAPETWLVLARALMGLGREVEAEEIYREALRRRPGYPEACADLANLTWMRTGDIKDALTAFDAAGPAPSPPLLLHKAKLLEYAGDLDGAAAALEAALAIVDDPLLHVAAAQVAVRTDPAAGLRHAQRAFVLRPENYSVIATLCQARLAAGRPDEAAPLAESLVERQGWDQYALALLATCWRLLGDRRYGEHYDYDRMVGEFPLAAPPGWASTEAWLTELVAALGPLHPFLGHPVGQSVRDGSQTRTDLTRETAPAIEAFFVAIDGPIRRYLAGLGRGDDPLRRRIGDGYRFQGAWSVRLRPGGFHVDHVHHKGWISSACHIALPAAIERGHEGWLKFGEPGVPTDPPLPPERFVRPEVGKLVLFPSYFWHGTAPFSGDETRLSIAFDLLPT